MTVVDETIDDIGSSGDRAIGRLKIFQANRFEWSSQFDRNLDRQIAS